MLLNSGYQLLKYIINERLKRIVEQTNVLKARQNGTKMTSFRGAMAKLGAGVDNELGGSAPHQCR